MLLIFDYKQRYNIHDYTIMCCKKSLKTLVTSFETSDPFHRVSCPMLKSCNSSCICDVNLWLSSETPQRQTASACPLILLSSDKYHISSSYIITLVNLFIKDSSDRVSVAAAVIQYTAKHADSEFWQQMVTSRLDIDNLSSGAESLWPLFVSLKLSGTLGNYQNCLI